MKLDFQMPCSWQLFPTPFLAAGIALLAGASASAQERPSGNFFDTRLRFAVGRLEHRTSGSNLDDETDAALVQFQFEFYGEQGLGGGLRFEGIASDDDLFADLGAPETQANSGDLFLFFGYRFARNRFGMPIRAGLVLNDYELDDDVLGEIDYFTAGFRVEAEPEFTLVHNDDVRWSLFASTALGIGATTIETDPDTFEADSTSLLFGAEFGTRVALGPISLGLGFVYRRLDIDDSETVGGFFYRGIESDFLGLQFTIAGGF